ncbi:MAG TPA: DUF2334 domain-containing protein [Chloroflexota bacterium]|nr:DUF2334 domain-containing protein [Chloroflexota bacterium]
MPGGKGSRQLIVSLHDVAPPFEATIRRQLAQLTGMGVDRAVLKVVPNWHGSHPLARSATLVALLRAQVESGSEIVLHGLEHRRRGSLRGPPPLRLRAALFAGDAPEFLTLSPAEAVDAVLEGRRMLEAAGLPDPTTFCAPGWLLATDVRRALPAAGIRQVAGMFALYDLSRGLRRLLPALGYMGADPAQEAGVSVLNRLLEVSVLPRAPAVKVYLHPQGAGSAAEQRVMARVARLVRNGWTAATYRELIGDR